MNYIWSMISVVGVQIISMGASIIIARAVGPTLVGTFNIAFVYITLLIVIHEAMLTSLIMFNRVKRSNTLKVSLTITTILAFLLVITGWILNKVYATESILIFILISLVGIISNSYFATEKLHYIKNEKFRMITIVDISVEIFSSIVAYIFLINDFLYIAIAFKISLRPFIGALLILFVFNKLQYSDDEKNLEFNKSMLFEKRSKDYLKSQIVIFFNNSIDYILIGKYFGLVNLGFYTIAYQWSVIFRQYVSAAISRVLFPKMIIFSESNKIDLAREYFLRIFTILAFSSFAFLTILFIFSGDFIKIFYGESWNESIEVLRILLLSAFITTVASIGGSVINGFGKPEIEKNINILSTIFLIVIIHISKNQSIEMVAWGILLKTIIMDSIKIHYVSSLLDLKNKQLFHILLKMITIPLLFVFMYAALNVNDDFNYLENSIFAFAFLVSYLILNKEFIGVLIVTVIKPILEKRKRK